MTASLSPQRSSRKVTWSTSSWVRKQLLLESWRCRKGTCRFSKQERFTKLLKKFAGNRKCWNGSPTWMTTRREAHYQENRTSVSCAQPLIDVFAQATAAVWVAQLSQCLCFDLSNTFAGNPEQLTYFFQGSFPTIIQPEAQTQDVTLAR